MKFYTVAEVAKLLKVSEGTIRRLIENRNLKAVKVGSSWRIAKDDLMEYLKKNKNV